MPAKVPLASFPDASSEERFRKTFERVYHDHVAALFRYGAQFRADQALVEDCVQELFADLWESNHTLGTIRSMRPYLLGALRRKILRKTHDSREQLLGGEDLFTLADRQSTKNASDHGALFSAEAIEHLAAALQKLTYKQQEVLYLRFYNQLSFQEIAGIMSVQTRTVYKLCHRAITTLNTHLSETLSAAHLLSLLLFYLHW